MITKRTRWLWAVLVCLVLWPAFAEAQQEAWERHMRAAIEPYQQGHYAKAVTQIQDALRAAEAFGPDDPRLATSLNNLAELYRLQGRYEEAEPLNKRALAIREKVLGPEHSEVATSLNNLAVIYLKQGRYAEAEPLYKRSLAIVEKALGAEHPNVAGSLNNLGEFYRLQGRYAEAEPLYKRSLAIVEKAVGAEERRVAKEGSN